MNLHVLLLHEKIGDRTGTALLILEFTEAKAEESYVELLAEVDHSVEENHHIFEDFVFGIVDQLDFAVDAAEVGGKQRALFCFSDAALLHWIVFSYGDFD